MTRFADWCAFLGAWLLFAGPVYQAESELDGEAREAREIRPVMQSMMPDEGQPSKWWWLLPPVAYVLHRRWTKGVRARVLEALTAEQTAQLVRFSEKALGWQLVGGGAGLIAIDETWVLVHAYRWPTGVFWALIAVMVAATFGFVSVRARRRYAILQLEHPSGPGPRGVRSG